MALLRESDLADFLKRKHAQFNGLLLFGNDASAISSAVSQVIAAMPDVDEPLRLDASSLRVDPARLDDAFRSMSLLGDRRVIVAQDVDETHLGLLQPLLAEQELGNFVVLVAGNLKKDSKLRVAAESSQRFSVTGFYEETGAAVLQRIEMLMKQRGLSFEEGALERFVDLCGSDRSVLLNEAEKLALYCHPQSSISIADVEAACGDQSEFEADQLITAVLDGELERADRIYSSMMQSGDAKSVLIMMQMYLARLEAVSAGLTAKPPFFGPQQAISGRQLRVLSGDDLGRMQVSVQQALLQSRQMADLGDAITGRCLMSLARMVRQLRARAA